MSLKFVKRLAAETLGVGESRIWLDPDAYDRLSTVVSREDIRRLVHDRVIKVKPKKGVSRGRARKVRKQKKKGLRRGPGSRKGGHSGEEKRRWMMQVRALRKYLKMLRDRRVISRSDYRKLRGYVKGGMLKTRAQIKAYIIEHGMARRRI